MRPSAAREAADLLWTLWSSGRTVDALPERCRPGTVDEGWQVQRALDALAGAHAGWKIAATSPAGQRHIGADAPLAGRLYERCLVPSGAEIDATHMTMRAAEAEFAFRLGTDVDSPDRPRVLAAVEALVPVIEVPDTRFADFLAVGLPSLVADAMCNRFLVIGEPVRAWEPASLPDHAVMMQRDGAEVSAGTGANVLGDPIRALVWLAGELENRGERLRAGDLVTTGACTPPNPVAPGDRLLADFGSLGAVRVDFASSAPDD
jgi:2-keto-4-pentenoate hydratase